MADSPSSPPAGNDGYGWPREETSDQELQTLTRNLARIDLSGLALTQIAVGQEHAVFTSERDELADMVVKITRPGGYGILMEASPDGLKIGWRRGSAREYLQRITRQNRVFADTVELLGWTPQRSDTGANWPSIVSAQRFRAGSPPTATEIRDLMTPLGFVQVPPAAVSLAYLRDHVFYSNAYNILASDCRSANFVKGPEGLAVIDVIVQRPVGALRHLLRQLLGLRLDPVQVASELEALCRELPLGRNRTLRASRLIEDLGGEGPTLTALKIAAVRYARGESGHDLMRHLETHAEASAGRG